MWRFLGVVSCGDWQPQAAQFDGALFQMKGEKFTTSGFFVSQSGVGVTLYQAGPDRNNRVRNCKLFYKGKEYKYKVIKEHSNKNFMVLQAQNAPVSSWILLNNLAAEIGERVALLGVSSDGNTCIEEGFMQEFEEKSGRTSTSNSGGLLGGPIINKNGELLGINTGVSGIFKTFTDTVFLPIA